MDRAHWFLEFHFLGQVPMVKVMEDFAVAETTRTVGTGNLRIDPSLNMQFPAASPGF
jgi:hypothetical protein